MQLLSIHAYGELLGEFRSSTIPHGGPRTASAVAMTNGTGLVEHDALFAWLDEHPRVAVDMLAHRMRANNERISDLVSWTFPAGWRRPAESGLAVRRTGGGGSEGAA